MNREIETVITRVQQMETGFDKILTILNTCPDKIRRDPTIQQMIQDLTVYMDSGQWLRDFECDSRGELPKDLKRGVLSEDGLYHLLSEIDKVGW